jgi:hypothetical protein
VTRARTARRAAAAFAALLGLGLAGAAGAASISNLSVVLNGGNSPNATDNTGGEQSQVLSAASIVSSTGSAFLTRYAGGAFADASGFLAADTSVTLNADYTISFDVTGATNQVWQLTLDTSRVGARTAVSDSIGDSAFDLTAVVGSLSGAGTITAGSLALAALANSAQSGDVNLAFNQTGNAVITGTGNGSVSLTFSFSATATSNAGFLGGDEAAVRMGQASTLTGFTAGQYPGAGSRTQAGDGHFVNAVISQIGVIPEPETGLLLAFGLATVAVRRRRALRRRA